MFWQLKDSISTTADGVLYTADDTLPPEEEVGNIEYKLKLIGKSPERLEQLATQMKWRLTEGNGEALYEIGIADNGQLIGLTPEELEASLITLKNIAEKLSADCSVIRQRSVPTGITLPERHVMEVLVRKRVNEEHFLEVNPHC
ncbi:GTP binding protein [Coelomomyces lativittatus]|nr:GTP binding protein [Coelomomyces lativittatus]